MKDKVKYILEVPVDKLEKDYECDITGLKITNKEEAQTLKRLLPLIKKPLMIRAETDILQEVVNFLDRECIIGIADENNYKKLVPLAISGNHKLIIRTPIDINLAKELNILASDIGLGLDKILIDTDIGGLGYGFEYGYSIMEKIKLENDKYLNMPLISFAAEETAKTKEAKDNALAPFLEITSAAAVKACGADYIVLNFPESVKIMRGLE